MHVNRQQTAAVACHFGTDTKKSGNYDKALEVLDKSLEVIKEEWGENALLAADSLEKMAEIYEITKDYTKAF